MKKSVQMIIILASVLFLLVFTSCKNSKDSNETLRNKVALEDSAIHIPASPYPSYRRIPGITWEEIAKIESLQKQKKSFVYGVMTTTEAFYNQNNEVRGFSALFCEWLTQLFEIPFVPKIMYWNEIFEGLESGDVDFTGDLTASEERRKTYLMTDAIAEREIKYFQIAGSPKLHDIRKTRLPHYGFLEGSTNIKAVSRTIEEDFRTFPVEDAAAAYQKLKNKEIDAFFAEGVEAFFDNYPDVIARSVFPVLYGPVSLTTQNSELAPIISVIQKALENNAIQYLTELYNIGHNEYMIHKLQMRLTEEEKKFIKENPTINIVAEYDNYPISFYDKYQKEWQGISLDVLSEIENLTGIKFNIINKNNEEWGVIFNMLQSGEASIITELLHTPEREGRFLWADSLFITDYYALLSKTEFHNIKINEIQHMRVGLTKNTTQADAFHRWFPNHKHLTEFSESNEAFRALDSGKIDVLMSTLSRLLMYTNYYEHVGYKANLTFDYPVGSAFGFNKDEEVLRSVVDKTMLLIDLNQISGQWMRKTYDYRIKVTQAQIPWLITVAALIALVLILLLISFQKTKNEGMYLEKVIEERTLELHNSQIDLESALLGAQAANKAKSTFLANMSHEIRTPINAIVGMTAIGKSAEDIAKKDYCFTKIGDASNHLLGVINDVLDMSKIEADKFELVFCQFSFEKLIKRVVNVVSFRIDEKHQVFNTFIDPAIPKFLVGDDQRLAQVITNLLSNAVKFTPDLGSISLNAKFIGTSGGTDTMEGVCTIQITVTDTGIGISNEQQTRLFQSFQQAETSTVRKFGGTGLGLTISKTIVEKMGGKIWINSELGKGATFGFTVQMKRAIEDDEETIHEENKFNINEKLDQFKGKKVLLVEDMEINREIVLALLEPSGMLIDQAVNGAEAVRIFKETPEKFDAILMDLQMPEMDGYEATREIRKLENKLIGNSSLSFKRIPIIAMTANVFQEDVERCLKMGMDAHVGKPLHFEEVLTKLHSFFNPID